MTTESFLPMSTESLVLVLDELRHMYDQMMETLRKLDEKATNLLGWASVALVIASALEFTSGKSPRPIMPLVVLGSAIAVYIAIVVLCLKAIWPQEYELPLSLDRDTLHDLYWSKDELDCQQQLVAQYIEAIKFNKNRIATKAHLVRWGLGLLPVLILLLVALATSGLWQDLFR